MIHPPGIQETAAAAVDEDPARGRTRRAATLAAAAARQQASHAAATKQRAQAKAAAKPKRAGKKGVRSDPRESAAHESDAELSHELPGESSSEDE